MSLDKAGVLVLDGMWNKSLAAVRALGKRGLYVAAGETTRLSTTLFSRYAAKKLVYPSPTSRPEAFMEWLLDEIRNDDYALVLPTEFSTQQLIAANREEVTRFTGFPFQDRELSARVHDKAWLMKYAIEHGYPVPETHLVDSIEDINKIAPIVPYPVIIKPRNSSGSRGIVRVKHQGSFVKKYLAVHERYPFPIIQELIPQSVGSGYGVGVLFNFASEPRAAFVYRRLQEYPVSGGPSTLRESVAYDEIKEMALSLLHDLKWVGPAMVEFKIDPRDGRPKLLEINPRLWGSLELAIRSGVNFPYMLYRLAVDGDVEPMMDYKNGVKCRWILPGGLMHLMTHPSRVSTFVDFFKRTDGDDILSLRDPMPVIGRLSSALTFLYDREMRQMLFR